MTADSSLIPRTANEIVALLRSEEISPLDLLDTLEERIAEVDGAVNAMVTLCFDRARQDAGRLMARPVGERGRLAGMPVAIKDLNPVAGVRTTWGSPIYADFVPARSDCLVEILEAEGAVIYAKTNTPEFGAGANTFNEVFGATVNPWDTTRSCAGSSGGSAVALATGQAWLASGSDLGGSLRYPAYCTGLATIRPTQGRIPAFNPTSTGERPPALLRMSTQGPITRSVADAGHALEVMAGHDPRDPFWVPARREQAEPASPVPVALVRTPPGTPVSPGVARALERAARMLEASGDYRVEEVEPPELGLCAEVWTGLITAETRTMMGEAIRESGSPDIIASLEHFESYHPAVDLAGYMGLLAERTRLLRAWTGFLQHHRLIVGPVSTIPPFAPNEDVGPRPGAERIFRSQSLLVTVNLLGLPSVAVCTGLDEGLPLGVQVIGARFADGLCLGAAATIEAAAGRVTPIDPR